MVLLNTLATARKKYGLVLFGTAVLGIFFFLESNPTAQPVIIEVSEQGFTPSDITVSQGSVVLFKNVGSLSHWPASNFHPTHARYPESDIRKCNSPLRSTLFDACQALEPGDSFSFTFHEAGSWTFHDHVRPRYSGRVIVVPKEGYRVPFSTELWHNLLYVVDRVVRIARNPQSEIPGLSLAQKDASGLLVGTVLQPSDLISSKNYENETIYHYVFNDVEIRKVVYQLGVTRTMEKILESSENGSKFDCHIGAHYVGRAAYDVFREKSITMCDASCHSGCYHGVMEGLLWDVGQSEMTDKVREMCALFIEDFSIQQCFHGAGHGVLAFSGYNLPSALDWCTDAAGDAKTSCYGGVFMENVTAAVGVSAGINDHTTDWVSFDDPEYPCTVLSEDEAIQQACYEMQTSWMLIVFSFDYDKVIERCSSIPKSMRTSCFKSIGRDISGTTFRDPVKIETFCAKVPDAYFGACILGAVNTDIDFWGSDLKGVAIPFCEALVREEARNACYKRIIERIPDLFTSKENRAVVCHALPEKHRDACIEQVLP